MLHAFALAFLPPCRPLQVIGTYTGTCYLIDGKEGHSSCGMPETCENVVASVQGGECCRVPLGRTTG